MLQSDEYCCFEPHQIDQQKSGESCWLSLRLDCCWKVTARKKSKTTEWFHNGPRTQSAPDLGTGGIQHCQLLNWVLDPSVNIQQWLTSKLLKRLHTSCQCTPASLPEGCQGLLRTAVHRSENPGWSARQATRCLEAAWKFDDNTSRNMLITVYFHFFIKGRSLYDANEYRK